jgi:hypothetical protein
MGSMSDAGTPSHRMTAVLALLGWARFGEARCGCERLPYQLTVTAMTTVGLLSSGLNT